MRDPEARQFDLHSCLTLPPARAARVMRWVCVASVIPLSAWIAYGGIDLSLSGGWTPAREIGEVFVVWILSMGALAIFLSAPQAVRLTVGGNGFALFKDNGRVKRSVTWEDDGLNVKLARRADDRSSTPPASRSATHEIMGIFPVHTFVTPPAFDAILQSATARGRRVVESRAQGNPPWIVVRILP